MTEDDLLTKHELVHGRTLFEVDGKYYINPDSYGISFGDGKAGICGSFICINNGDASNFATIENNLKMAYGEASELHQSEGFTEEKYLKLMDIAIPENCVIWFDVEDDIDSDYPIKTVELTYGIKTADGSKLKEDGQKKR